MPVKYEMKGVAIMHEIGTTNKIRIEFSKPEGFFAESFKVLTVNLGINERDKLIEEFKDKWNQDFYNRVNKL